MGCIPSKQAKEAADKAVDAAVDNKDKVVASVKTAGAKAGVSQTAVDTAAAKVEQALSDKEGLKAQVTKALGDDTSPAAANRATAEAVAEAAVAPAAPAAQA